MPDPRWTSQKKKAVPLLNGTALSTQGSGNPELLEGTKKKMRPILGLMIMGEHNEAIDNQCAFRNDVGGGASRWRCWGVWS